MKKSQRERSALGFYLSKLLYDFRTSNGYSHQEFAEILDLSLRCYVNDEHGLSLCSMTTMLRFLSIMKHPMPVVHHCVYLLDAARDADPDS